MDECLGDHEAVAALPMLRQLIVVQIVSQVVIVGDRVVRYGLRWSSRTLRERAWFGWHKSFDLFAVIPFTTYTVLWLCIVFRQHPSPQLFYASQIALQSALVTIQVFQASISKRVLATIAKKSATAPMILIPVLGVCTIVLTCVPPSPKTCIYRGVFVTAITVVNETTALSFLCYCLIAANKRTTACRSIAWILRFFVILTTAVFGGFYLRTIWPLWSPQVVIIQQVNLLLSLEMACGTDTISAIKDFRDRKRRGKDNILPSRNRRYSELRTSSLQHQQDGSPSQDRSTSQSVVGSASIDDIPIKRERPDDSRSGEFQATSQALERVAAEALQISGFQHTFEEARTVQKQEVETAEDKLPDENETRMAQQWSKPMEVQMYLVESENDYSTASTFVKIIGVECKSSGDGVQWWYLTQQSDMTLHSDNCAELNSPFGNVRTVLPLHHGYQFVQFSPNWVRCRKVPKACRAEFWGIIGPKFWSLTTLCSDVTWIARQNRYLNPPEKLSVHLCMEEDCEACKRRYGDL